MFTLLMSVLTVLPNDTTAIFLYVADVKGIQYSKVQQAWDEKAVNGV